VLGHLRGVPATMQQGIAFGDLVGEVIDELGASLARARSAGVTDAAVLLDPGIGFGKDARQSAALVAASEAIEAALGRPVLHLAYPYGDRLAAGPREFALAKAAGFKTAVTTRPGAIDFTLFISARLSTTPPRSGMA